MIQSTEQVLAVAAVRTPKAPGACFALRTDNTVWRFGAGGWRPLPALPPDDGRIVGIAADPGSSSPVVFAIVLDDDEGTVSVWQLQNGTWARLAPLPNGRQPAHITAADAAGYANVIAVDTDGDVWSFWGLRWQQLPALP